ncbi:ubiquitin-like protein 7 isoform X2 [Babylonia areolata]|uniref:ubiquitin-like protein 7 isoform X2 n=1 Tax=Babylonia areolata TaxID=304850 RepID=UPI003FCFB115
MWCSVYGFVRKQLRLLEKLKLKLRIQMFSTKRYSRKTTLITSADSSTHRTKKKADMSSLHVCMCDCTSGYKTRRFDIPLSKLGENSDSLLTEIGKEIGSTENEFEVVYCGQKLDRGMALGTFSLTPQSTLFVFLKSPPARPMNELSGLQIASEMMPLINKAVQKPNYKRTVDHIMTTPDALQKLLTAVPGLDKDPTAMAMLQDPELLQLLAHRSNVHKVLKMHPMFGAAAVYLAKAVEEEYARDPSRPPRNNVYSLDRMSDDEDEGSQPRGAAAPVPPPQITASQVAAALAAATASASAAHASVPSSSTGATAGGPVPNASAMLSEFFQQRATAAQNSALEAQLQQLRDMGITDENVARQALTATNGDLQAALEIIFADENM